MDEESFHDFALNSIFLFPELCAVKIKGTATALAMLTQKSSRLIAHVQITLFNSLI